MRAALALAAVVALPLSQARYPEYVVSDLATGWVLADLVWVGAYLGLVLGARRVALGCAGAALTATARRG